MEELDSVIVYTKKRISDTMKPVIKMKVISNSMSSFNVKIFCDKVTECFSEHVYEYDTKCSESDNLLQVCSDLIVRISYGIVKSAVLEHIQDFQHDHIGISHLPTLHSNEAIRKCIFKKCVEESMRENSGHKSYEDLVNSSLHIVRYSRDVIPVKIKESGRRKSLGSFKAGCKRAIESGFSVEELHKILNEEISSSLIRS